MLRNKTYICLQRWTISLQFPFPRGKVWKKWPWEGKGSSDKVGDGQPSKEREALWELSAGSEGHSRFTQWKHPCLLLSYSGAKSYPWCSHPELYYRVSLTWSVTELHFCLFHVKFCFLELQQYLIILKAFVWAFLCQDFFLLCKTFHFSLHFHLEKGQGQGRGQEKMTFVGDILWIDLPWCSC